MSSDGSRVVERAQRNLNVIEQITSVFTSSDDYLATLLDQNEDIITLLEQESGIIDTDNLPIDMAGIALEDIDEGSVGDAMFNIQGNRFVVSVEADRSNVDAEDIVIVSGEGNTVIEGPSASDSAIAKFFSGVPGAAGKPEVVGKEQPVLVGNQTYINGNYTDIGSSLGQGEDKEFARIEPSSGDKLLFRAINATQHTNVRYDVYVDDSNNVYEPLSGASPPAAPPDWFEPVEDGYIEVEDFVSVHIVETSGSNTQSNVEAKLSGVVVPS